MEQLCFSFCSSLASHWIFAMKKITEKDNYLRSYRSELVVAEKINLSLVWVTAEMQGLISINSKAQNTKEKHSN